MVAVSLPTTTPVSGRSSTRVVDGREWNLFLHNFKMNLTREALFFSIFAQGTREVIDLDYGKQENGAWVGDPSFSGVAGWSFDIRYGP